jgi:hypothetical protein
MVRANIKADDALKFTQSALNLAHTKAQLSALEKGSMKKAAGA